MYPLSRFATVRIQSKRLSHQLTNGSKSDEANRPIRDGSYRLQQFIPTATVSLCLQLLHFVYNCFILYFLCITTYLIGSHRITSDSQCHTYVSERTTYVSERITAKNPGCWWQILFHFELERLSAFIFDLKRFVLVCKGSKRFVHDLFTIHKDCTDCIRYSQI